MTCTYKFNTKDGEVKLVGQPAMKAWLAVNGIDAIVAPKGGKYGANPHLVEGEDGQRAKGSAQMSGSDEHVQKGEAETVQAAVEGKHPREIADWLAENSPRADHKIVAQKVADTIRRMESEGAIFNFRVAHMGDIANAELDHSLAVTNFGIDKDRTIVADISVNGADVHGRVGVGYEPILHELVHAVTAVGLELGMTRQFANTELGEAASDLKRIRELVMYTVTERIAAGTATRFEKHLKMLQNNGLKNIHEITAWSLTNTDMQKLMEGIKTGQQTVWSKFVEAVRKILGLSPRNDTALSDVLRISEQIMNTNLTIYAHDLKYDPYLSIVEPTMNKTVGRNFTTEMRDAYHSEVRKGVRYSVNDDYRDEHRAPGREDGAPLSDLTGDGNIYPDDVYSANGLRYYGTGVSYDKEAFQIANRLRGKPDAEVTIYRAIPSNIAADINDGDWVAITKQYAIDHGESRFDGDYKIISKKVRAGDIFTNGDSIQEWGYNPESDKYSVDNGKAQAEFGPVHTEFRDDAAGAVKQLMADKDGEAIVHRDDVGDISLVYGDGKMGLSHIVNRRGAGFVDRIPDLLRDGTLYSKPGQKDRVFIGTDRDEAVLRFEWDGKAKTWLLSAYEKYPDLKPAGESVQESRRSQVVDERSNAPLNKDSLRAAVTRGALGKVINSMIDAGVVVLHDNTSTLPRNADKGVKGVQAVTIPDGTVHLVAANLSKKNAMAVMLHEAFHQGVEKLLGTEQWGALMGRLGSLYRQGQQSNGKANEFFEKARARVAAAKAKGGVSAKMELEEFAAYAIEEYESAPASIKKWVDDLLGMVKAWVAKRFGKQIGNITPAQLSAFAKWAVMDQAVERRGDIFGDIGTLFSVGELSALDDGMVSGGDQPSVNGLKRNAEAITNFLESKAVRSKPDGGFNIPSTVMSHMLYVTDDQKVFRSIIASIPVDVMDFLARKKLSPENVLRDKAVLENMFAVHRKPSVSLGVDKTVAAALMHTVARHAAEVSSMTGGALESGAAGEAGASNAIFSNQNNSDLNGLGNYKNTTKEKNFLKWFGNSKVVDDSGKPLVMYHATTGDFGEFKENTRGVHFVSPSPEWVGKFLTEESGATAENANVMPVYVSAENPFDYENKKHVSTVAAHASLGSAAISQIKKGSWQRLEDRTLLATIKKLGFDGLYVKEDGVKNLAVFRPEQIKSAIGNNGAFDPANPDIRYSLADDTSTTTAPAAPQDPNRYTPPEQGLARRVQAAVQDNMNRVTQVQEKIKELTGHTTLGKADYRAAEVNRPGRIAARLEDAQDKLTGPLMKKLAQYGKTPEQLSELLHAQHAQERNEAVARINDQMPDGGSGMTTAEAKAIIKRHKGDAQLQELANDARAIAKATLDLKLAYGLIKPQDHEMLATMYQHYVPLKGDGEYGTKIKRAMGHDEREEHILENIARDYEQAVVTGEKNLARQSLLQMVLKFADPELWTVGMPPRGRYVAGKIYSVQDSNGKEVGRFTSQSQVTAFLEGKGAAASRYSVYDSAGEHVTEFTKPLQDNEVMVYVKGDPVRIQIFDEKLAAQLRPLNQGQMGPILENFRKINRYLSSIYTGYNPAFILRNATRDAITGTINMLGNEGAAVAAKAWGKYPVAVAALGQWATTKKAPDTKAGRYLTEYRMHGGKTGASYMSDLEQQGENLQFMYDKTRGLVATAKEGNVKRTASVAWNKTVGRLAHVVEIANQATENGLRLGLYMALREEGVSADKAAQAAKSVTVDFDRKGASTGALGAIYLFFNPAVQGTANAMKTLMHGQHKGQAWAALGGLVAAGFLAASKGMDEDKDKWLGEGWETRTKNLIINTPGHQFRAPMSQEFAPAYAFGVAMAEAARGESKVRTAARIVSSFIDAYFPLQGAYKEDSDNHLADAAQAATPTVLKPLIESAMNRNSFGSQVVPESELTKDKPDNLKMNRGTKNTAYDKAAQGIAAAGESIFGVGKYENDITKVSPETLKSLWRTYTGGLGQFITDSAGVAAMGGRDPSQIEASDVPIIKDFYRPSTVGPIRSRYFDLSKDAKAAITEFEQAKKLGDGAEMSNIVSGEKAKLVGLGKMVRSISKAAAVLGDEKVSINASTTLTDAEKRAELKRIEAQEEELYRSGIEAFK